MLEAICPNGHRLQVPPEHAGLKLRCPACNAVFQLIGPRIEPAAVTAGAAAAHPAPTPPTTSAPTTNGAAAAESAPAGNAAAPAPAAASPTIQPMAEVPGTRWSGSEPPVSTAPGNTVAAPPSNSVSSSKVVPTTAAAPTSRPDWLAGLYLGIKPMLVLGLVMALSARGCDALAVKNVARLQGALDLERREFRDESDAAVAALVNQMKQANVTPTRRAELQKQFDDLKAAQEKKLGELEAGAWHELSVKSERAAIDARAGAYGRELLFLAGTILFAVGLLTTSLLGEGAERWLCFSLLAIVVFSLYVGGTAWTAAILSDVKR